MIIADLINKAILRSQIEKTITSKWVEEGVGPLDVIKSSYLDEVVKKPTDIKTVALKL